MGLKATNKRLALTKSVPFGEDTASSNAKLIGGDKAMDYQTIILEKVDHVATITLNRPERLNALTDDHSIKKHQY